MRTKLLVFIIIQLVLSACSSDSESPLVSAVITLSEKSQQQEIVYSVESECRKNNLRAEPQLELSHAIERDTVFVRFINEDDVVAVVMHDIESPLRIHIDVFQSAFEDEGAAKAFAVKLLEPLASSARVAYLPNKELKRDAEPAPLN